jgi:hypothetical protein
MRATEIGLPAPVDVAAAPNTATQIQLGAPGRSTQAELLHAALDLVLKRML